MYGFFCLVCKAPRNNLYCHFITLSNIFSSSLQHRKPTFGFADDVVEQRDFCSVLTFHINDLCLMFLSPFLPRQYRLKHHGENYQEYANPEREVQFLPLVEHDHCQHDAIDGFKVVAQVYGEGRYRA